MSADQESQVYACGLQCNLSPVPSSHTGFACAGEKPLPKRMRAAI